MQKVKFLLVEFDAQEWVFIQEIASGFDTKVDFLCAERNGTKQIHASFDTLKNCSLRMCFKCIEYIFIESKMSTKIILQCTFTQRWNVGSLKNRLGNIFSRISSTSKFRFLSR